MNVFTLYMYKGFNSCVYKWVQESLNATRWVMYRAPKLRTRTRRHTLINMCIQRTQTVVSVKDTV
jgi:hypothetical protein